MFSQRITLDVLNHEGGVIYCRVGEGSARRVFLGITSGGDRGIDTEYVNIDNPVVTVRILKPDKTFVYVTATLTSGAEEIQEFAFYIPEEATQVSGVGRYDVRIQENGEDNIIYTAEGRVLIDDDMITDGMIASVAAVNGLVFPDDFLTTETGAAVIDDTTTSENSTWSSDKIAEEITSEIDDAITGLIDDSLVDDDSTWSSDKITTEIEDAVSGLSTYTEEVLWTGPETPTTSGTDIILSDSWRDYSQLIICTHDGSYNYKSQTIIYLSQMANNDEYIAITYDPLKLGTYIQLVNNTTVKVMQISSGYPLVYDKIIGVKY